MITFEKRYMSAREAAAYVGICYESFRIKAKRGEIECYRPNGPNGHARFFKKDLDAYIEKTRNKKQAKVAD